MFPTYDLAILDTFLKNTFKSELRSSAIIDDILTRRSNLNSAKYHKELSVESK